VLSALGVAIGLALSGTLQNSAGGFLIILLKPFSVGENIMTQSEEGIVTFKRPGQPAELASICVQLAAVDGSHATGQIYGSSSGAGQP
jgi:hypothetical protein